jgi:hypothetical protein
MSTEYIEWNAGELVGWNLDGWYMDRASAEGMAAWYADMRDVGEVHIVDASNGGQFAVLYHGQPFTFWHTGRRDGYRSEDVKRILYFRELLPKESKTSLRERLNACPYDDQQYHEVHRELRRRAAEPKETTDEPATVTDVTVESQPAVVSVPSVPAGVSLDRPPACVTDYNAGHTWAELLEGDGWNLHHVDRDGREHWVRPGKDARRGSSATVGHGGVDVLHVFTTSIAWLPSNRSYDRFGYMTHRDFAGDFAEAVRAMTVRNALKADGKSLPPDNEPASDNVRPGAPK